jgi:hypothetical protein
MSASRACLKRVMRVALEVGGAHFFHPTLRGEFIRKMKIGSA